MFTFISLNMAWIGLMVFTQLLTSFQLYRGDKDLNNRTQNLAGGQFYWRRPI